MTIDAAKERGFLTRQLSEKQQGTRVRITNMNPKTSKDDLEVLKANKMAFADYGEIIDIRMDPITITFASSESATRVRDEFHNKVVDDYLILVDIQKTEVEKTRSGLYSDKLKPSIHSRIAKTLSSRIRPNLLERAILDATRK